MPQAILPQLQGRMFLTDGGLETTLIFHEGVDLPHFAAFILMRTPQGRAQLRRYYERYIGIAEVQGLGFVLESPTWRASADWAERLDMTSGELAELNRASIELMRTLRVEHPRIPMVVSGCIGPRGDGYDPGQVMTAAAAQAYHVHQVETFRAAGADMVTAVTMTNTPEAIGIARAAQAAGLPAAISFTVETDGRLPTGLPLRDAIEVVDEATFGAPAYYMINCAHPSHFAETLAGGGAWTSRIRGLRANASRRSHEELNDSPDLDEGDPVELGDEHAAILRQHPQIRILGGCCGTDHRHVTAMSLACREVA